MGRRVRVACVLAVAATLVGPQETSGDPPVPPVGAAGQGMAPAPIPPIGYEATFPFGARSRHLDAGARDEFGVIRGLRWLVSRQEKNGRWRAGPASSPHPEHDLGVTALAVLALLGAGFTPAEGGPFGDAVAAGLVQLRGAQDADGAIGDRRTKQFVYSHAFAALALVEGFGLTGDDALRTAAHRAIDYIQLARNPYLVWRYGGGPGDNDTSVSGCMWSAVHAARVVNRAAVSAGLEAPFRIDRPWVDDAQSGLHSWIEWMTDVESGRVGYQSRGSRPSRIDGSEERFPPGLSEAPTAIGLWARLATGEPPWTDPGLRGTRLLLKCRPTWNPAGGTVDLYYWYFGSLALNASGGAPWSMWRADLHAALGQGIQSDGRTASWEPDDPWSSVGGPVYTTAMAILCLETEWRYPGHKKIREGVLGMVASPAAHATARREAIRWLLGSWDAEAAKAAALALSAPAVEVRRAAAEAIAASPGAGDASVLAGVTKDADEDVRVHAARGLGGIRGAKSAIVLGQLLSDPSRRVRVAAADSLRRLGREAEAVAGVLRQAVADPGPALRVHAARALWAATKDTAVLPVLVAGLEEADAEVRSEAALGLRDMGAAAAPADAALAKQLKFAGTELVVDMCDALWAVTEHRRAEASELARALESSERAVRIRSVEVFAAYGPAGAQGAGAFAAALRDESLAVRLRTISALVALGREARDAVPALRAAAVDPEPDVARAAGSALRRIQKPQPPDPKAPPPPRDTADATRALGRPETASLLLSSLMANPSSATLLLPLLRAPEPILRIRAIEILGEVPGVASGAVNSLSAAATDADPGVRAAALRALRGAAPAVAALHSFVVALGDADDRVRAAALDGLVALAAPVPEAIPALQRAVEGAEPWQALAACEVLRRWKVVDTRSALAILDPTRSEPPWKRAAAAVAIARDRPWKAEAFPLLRSLLALPSGDPVRTSFESALVEDIGREPSRVADVVAVWATSDIPAGQVPWLPFLRIAGDAVAPFLSKYVRAGDALLTYTAVDFLLPSEEVAVKSFAVLVASLPADEPIVHRRVAALLLRGGSTKAGLDALAQGLRHPEGRVRTASARIAALLEERAVPLKPALTRALKSEKTSGDAEEALRFALWRIESATR